MIKRTGKLFYIFAIFTIFSVSFFSIGGCNDSNGGDGIGGGAGCTNISGTANGDIRTTGDVDCDTQIEDGCFFGGIMGSLNGDEQTIYDTKEDFNVLNSKFTEFTGITLVIGNNGDDQLSGNVVTVVDKDGKAAAILIQWFSEGSFGKYEGATGHVVQNMEIDPESMTYTSTWSGELCLP